MLGGLLQTISQRRAQKAQKTMTAAQAQMAQKVMDRMAAEQMAIQAAEMERVLAAEMAKLNRTTQTLMEKGAIGRIAPTRPKAEPSAPRPRKESEMSVTLTTGTDDRARIVRALRYTGRRIRLPHEKEALERLEKAVKSADLIVFEDQ